MCRTPFLGGIQIRDSPETLMSLAHPEMHNPESHVVIGMI